jgi:hypothetical protein
MQQPETTTTETPAEPTLYTQAELNNVLRRERLSLQQQVRDLESELAVQRGVRQSEADELTDRLVKLGVEIAEGETPEAAAQRWIADAESRPTDIVEDESDPRPTEIEKERDGYRSELHSLKTRHAIEKAARAAGAFNSEQVVDLLQKHAKTLPNGELVFVGAMPDAMQSASEVVDYLRVSQPNLFKSGLGLKS